MEEESINPKSKYKKAFIAALIIIVISVLGVTAYLFISAAPVKQIARQLASNVDSEKSLEGWAVPATRKLWKDKFWIQNQIAMAKDDSMCLGVNFEDSTMQLLFKGLTFEKYKIFYRKPDNFLDDINSKIYKEFFGDPAKIVSGYANTEKKSFRRMKPPTTEEGDPVYLDSISNNPIVWDFTTSNNIRFVVHGFDAYNDTAKIVPKFNSDILRFRLNGGLKTSEYIPILFIWMDDKDAKAIYKALPHKAQVIFRN